MVKDSAQQIKLINQALAAAQASIDLSRQLLAELTNVPTPVVNLANRPQALGVPEKINSSPFLGIVGTYDGENMVTASGEKHTVPANYASKTVLVFGDTLKMIEQSAVPTVPGAPNRASGKLFKQIERVKRQRVAGVLTQKEGVWYLATSDGSHKVLEAAVLYYGLKVGDTAVGILPKDNNQVPFAALEGPEKPATLKPESQVLEVIAKTPAETTAKGEEVIAVKPLPAKQKETKAKKEVAENSEKLEKNRVSIPQEKVPDAPKEKTSIKEVPEKKAEKGEKKPAPLISEDDLR